MTHFRQDLFFTFILQGDVETCMLWLGVRRKDISQTENFFVHVLFTNFPKNLILKHFRRLGCNFLFNSVDVLPQLSRCFCLLLQIQNKQTKLPFLISRLCVALKAFVKSMEGNKIMCATWILKYIHLVLRASLMGTRTKHYVCVCKLLLCLETDQGIK